jgi:hypothetical protein
MNSSFPGEENTCAAGSDVGGLFFACALSPIANIILTAFRYTAV